MTNKETAINQLAKQITCKKFNLTSEEFDEALAAVTEWENWENETTPAN